MGAMESGAASVGESLIGVVAYVRIMAAFAHGGYRGFKRPGPRAQQFVAIAGTASRPCGHNGHSTQWPHTHR